MSDGQNSNNDRTEVVKASLSAGSTLLVAIIAAIGGIIGSYFTGSKLVESTSVPALINARTICINAANED